MTLRNLLAVSGLCAVMLSSVSASEGSISLAEKASLQAAMQRHIDSVLVTGRYLHMDEDSGEVRALRPLAAHPVILRMGEYYVMCADFRGENGAEVNVDYYLARKGSSFVVFDEQVENRALVHKLMKSGKITKVK